MNPMWSQQIIDSVLQNKKKQKAETVSRFRLAKRHKELKINAALMVKDIMLISIGIFAAAFGLEGFLLPNKFIDGGATGIALLLTELTKISLSVILIAVNIPFIILGYKVISRRFVVRAGLSILGLAIVLAFVNFPIITHEKLLVALFGGFFLGAGIGLTVRSGAVLDGTEILAIAISRKLRVTIGDVIIIINLVIFSAAAYFLSIETALYSMITYLAASKTLDFIIEGIEEYTGVTIVSSHSEEIRLMIINNMGRGVTVYKGRRGFGKTGETKEMDIIYTVITRLEVNKLNGEIEKIDPNAFVVMNSIKDTKGGMIKKRAFRE
jgi:uncharacterized membrane-anchored protein YitT (DUF2179 family)